MIQESPFFARKKKGFFALRGVRSLVRHVKAVGRQGVVGVPSRAREGRVKVSKFLHYPHALLQEPLFDVVSLFLVHVLHRELAQEPASRFVSRSNSQPFDPDRDRQFINLDSDHVQPGNLQTAHQNFHGQGLASDILVVFDCSSL